MLSLDHENFHEQWFLPCSLYDCYGSLWLSVVVVIMINVGVLYHMKLVLSGWLLSDEFRHGWE